MTIREARAYITRDIVDKIAIDTGLSKSSIYYAMGDKCKFSKAHKFILVYAEIEKEKIASKIKDNE